jgi:hypothetical protein
MISRSRASFYSREPTAGWHYRHRELAGEDQTFSSETVNGFAREGFLVAVVDAPSELVVALIRSLTQAPKKDLLTSDGGDSPRSEPCKAVLNHGFPGLDAEVVTAIASLDQRCPGPEVG